ncbi:MAG: tolA [Myxococcaceae bacterium]|nr:tolA [Myxococcaceae bacterium]
MCRNIKTLFNFEPPATDDEVRAASLQFVRKLSGFSKPSQANEAAFAQAVEDVAAVARVLLDSLSTTSPAKDRAAEAEKARERSLSRFPRV